MPINLDHAWPNLHPGQTERGEPGDVKANTKQFVYFKFDWKLVPDSKLHGANMGPPGSGRTQMGPMLAPWTLLPWMLLQFDNWLSVASFTNIIWETGVSSYNHNFLWNAIIHPCANLNVEIRALVNNYIPLFHMVWLPIHALILMLV